MKGNSDSVKGFPVKQVVGVFLFLLVFSFSTARDTGVDLDLTNKSRVLGAHRLRGISGNMTVQVQELGTDESGSNSLGLDMIHARDNTRKSDTKTPSERLLVKDGSMSLSTAKEKGHVTATLIEAKVSEMGGYVEEKSSYQKQEASYHDVDGRTITPWVIDMTVQIPSSHFDDFGNQLQSNIPETQVTGQSFRARDVTDQYLDAASRAQTLRAAQQAMQLLLEKATSIQDVLRVQVELTRLTQDYEAYQARASHLEGLSGWSTWRITIAEQYPHDSDEEPLFVSIMRCILLFIKVFVISFASFFAILIALIALAIYCLPQAQNQGISPIQTLDPTQKVV